MISITQTIKQFIAQDQIHLESLRNGTLNLRAYAKLIHFETEKISKKSIKIGSMVMALSRIAKNLERVPSLKPKVEIEGLNVKSGLSIVNYEKTAETIAALSKINIARSDKDFFVITESLAEIAIVAGAENIKLLEKSLHIKPKSKFIDAVAITLRFDEHYVAIPNVLYAFVSALAMQRINLLEVVSTLTEVSFVIENKYMDHAIRVFQQFLK